MRTKSVLFCGRHFGSNSVEQCVPRLFLVEDLRRVKTMQRLSRDGLTAVKFVGSLLPREHNPRKP